MDDSWPVPQEETRIGEQAHGLLFAFIYFLILLIIFLILKIKLCFVEWVYEYYFID